MLNTSKTQVGYNHYNQASTTLDFNIL